ncbi:MAG: hypothetical protein SGI71_08790 [Verrucomicrobiota bacterium]|nr:hypothetical protein [Verrucomicrobiota bacterium]
MMRPFLLIIALFFGAQGGIIAAPKKQAVDWEKSIVMIEVTRKQYDYIQPWSRRLAAVEKNGVVLNGKRILTTAEHFSNQTLIRIQKGGRGKWWTGKLTWVDYHANLALVTCQDDKFWEQVQPAELAEKIPTKGSASFIRWKDGNFQTQNAYLEHPTVMPGQLTFAPYLHLAPESNIEGAGWAEPLVYNDKLIGITSSQEKRTLNVIPSPFIRSIFQSVAKGTYSGIGYFDFKWQENVNPASASSLKLQGEPRGVVVTKIHKETASKSEILEKDIILNVDGFDIDAEGDYQDPVYGHLSFENLATRQGWANTILKVKVWREGKQLDVNYILPRADDSQRLVPSDLYDQAPEYSIYGGLVFQPLTEPFLKSWGADYMGKAPFRLAYYNQQGPATDHKALLMMTMVLPDMYNLGYQDYRFLLLNKVNGVKVSSLIDLKKALQSPQGEFHVIEFLPGSVPEKIVLDAAGLDQATQRVLKRYAIPEPSYISTANTAL